ncbi:hypothetical protein E4U32_000623 [Claviceps aff. humidiphila group G2b]|nr:hypothetical protein E4U32_000623 [Claviceps aff. humidiphila group G2b]
MAGMAPYNTNGPKNGADEGASSGAPSNQVFRPFTLQESLPFSPQTSIAPFLPGKTLLPIRYSLESFKFGLADSALTDIIPDPCVGSGSPSLGISDLYSTQEFDKVNQEAAFTANSPKNLKQTVDHVLHDLKPSMRTQ